MTVAAVLVLVEPRKNYYVACYSHHVCVLINALGIMCVSMHYNIFEQMS